MKHLLPAVLFALFTLTASAADLGGTWKGTLEGPNGSVESTFNFKLDAGKLGGTVTMGPLQNSPITDGKLDQMVIVVSTAYREIPTEKSRSARLTL